MFNISSFLEKFSRNVQNAEIFNVQILDIVEKHTQIRIPTTDIEIKNGIVLIKASPGVKNKIFIFKNKILEDITKSIPVKILDIK